MPWTEVEYCHNTGIPASREDWKVERVVCNSCGARWVAKRTTATDPERLECPQCGRYDSTPLDVLFGAEGAPTYGDPDHATH